MAQSLNGKVALVTGASSGIGAATVSELLSEGVRVVAAARRLDRLSELQRTLGADGEHFLAVQCDIRDEVAADQLVRRAVGWGGRLDVLVNNAGLARGALHEHGTVEDLRVMLDTNVFALANLTRLATPALKQSRGNIVNVASTVVRALGRGSAVYAATKAAVAAFSEVVRKELCADNVRVITVFPGFVETEFLDNFDDRKRRELEQARAALQALEARDVAEVIAFALTRPPHVSLNEIFVRPTMQAG
ncbi:SDR family oxidoreductase [Azoarcus sp. DN11]|uniref:SDR family oxidoreductase n=1 Tax=Azoarcus sp. DN11 TaxID=356837 RepID=UPI000EB51472|nr:SDR family oxidoreductase [Azoarcus sp. DN11]AYH43573.1 hypothetical protein CDA09_09280 [Azoarcus sp. DN11]